MGDILLADESLIGGVVEDDGAVGVGVVHPRLQLLPGGYRAGGVVGEAEVDDVHLLTRGNRGKAVLLHTGHVDQLVPSAQLLLVVTGPAGHGVGIHIDRVHRVAHRHHVVQTEDVANVAAVALGAVGDKDLLRLDVHAPGGVVVLGNGLPQEVVALLRAIAVEALEGAHLGDGLVHSLDDSRGQGAGHVADGQPDDLGAGVGGGVGGDPAVDLGEEVAAGQLQIVLVDVGHGETPPLQKNLQTIMAEFCPAVNPNLRATPPRTR